MLLQLTRKCKTTIWTLAKNYTCVFKILRLSSIQNGYNISKPMVIKDKQSQIFKVWTLSSAGNGCNTSKYTSNLKFPIITQSLPPDKAILVLWWNSALGSNICHHGNKIVASMPPGPYTAISSCSQSCVSPLNPGSAWGLGGLMPRPRSIFSNHNCLASLKVREGLGQWLLPGWAMNLFEHVGRERGRAYMRFRTRLNKSTG